MNFFIKEENIRNGNRGGRNLFNWNDVRLMNNRDRESYLGASQIIGYLDKGGKWCKSDWWINYKNTNNLSNCIKNKDTLLDDQRINRIENIKKRGIYDNNNYYNNKSNIYNDMYHKKQRYLSRVNQDRRPVSSMNSRMRNNHMKNNLNMLDNNSKNRNDINSINNIKAMKNKNSMFIVNNNNYNQIKYLEDHFVEGIQQNIIPMNNYQNYNRVITPNLDNYNNMKYNQN